MIINYAEQAFDIYLRSIANGNNLEKDSLNFGRNKNFESKYKSRNCWKGIHSLRMVSNVLPKICAVKFSTGIYKDI